MKTPVRQNFYVKFESAKEEKENVAGTKQVHKILSPPISVILSNLHVNEWLLSCIMLLFSWPRFFEQDSLFNAPEILSATATTCNHTLQIVITVRIFHNIEYYQYFISNEHCGNRNCF